MEVSKRLNRTTSISKQDCPVHLIINYKADAFHLFFRANEDDEDVIDSDFSIDENDEPVSDNEDEGQKKKRRVVTKAYKVLTIIGVETGNICGLILGATGCTGKAKAETETTKAETNDS